MRRIRRQGWPVVVLFLIGGLLSDRSGAIAQDGCTAAGCHASLLDARHVHPGAESCDRCHEPVATPHPQEGRRTSRSDLEPLLVKRADELCLDCHADLQEALQQPHLHPALQQGCTRCHDPHGSEYPKLLPSKVEQVCAVCHVGIASTLATVPMVHAALKSDKSCSSCHSPHASANQKLLLPPEMEVCLGCHPAVVTRDMTVLHGPINDGNCTACHTPHGGRHARLLVDEFPQGSYVPYTDTAFPLCFRCHDRDLVREPKTSSATGFRDGEGNLHYLHMSQEQKGQSCRLCHVFHGGKGRHLLAASVPLGELSLPLQFEATPDGGRCTPGCHEPQSYRR